jgi:hypothetical protein
MATQEDVRHIALSLPDVTQADDAFAFYVHGNVFAWMFLERVHPDKPRVPNPDVLAVRVSGEDDKEALVAMNPDLFFSNDRYPAILVRLPDIEFDELEDVLIDAWYLRAPKRLRLAFDRNHQVEYP